MNTHIGHLGGRLASRPGVKVLRIAGLILAGVGLAVLFAFVFGIVVKVLWNWLMPVLFGLGRITFWQAFGIVLLAKLLFGGFGHSHQGRDRHFESRFQEHCKGFVRSEKAAVGEAGVPGNGKKWRHFQQYWQDEGRTSFESYVRRMETQGEKKPQDE
jgi:hypothetical protein